MQFESPANLMTARQLDLPPHPHPPPLWDRGSNRRGGEETSQQLSLCFACEKSSWRVTLKSVLACDILGYTQLHSEPVTPCHFLPHLGDVSVGEVSQLPDLLTFWLKKVIRTVQRRTHENGWKKVNEIAHICLWKRKWILNQTRSSQRFSPTHQMHQWVTGSSVEAQTGYRLTNTNSVKLLICQGMATCEPGVRIAHAQSNMTTQVFCLTGEAKNRSLQ